MSLDVSLHVEGITGVSANRIYIRQDGQTKEITRAEWDVLHPGIEPVTTSQESMDEVFSANITHNLALMASRAGIYEIIWKPDNNGIERANDLIYPLEQGLQQLRNNPDYYQRYNPANGWGSYEVLVDFVRSYLEACKKYPEATISVSR